jgi:hypothetical protein
MTPAQQLQAVQPLIQLVVTHVDAMPPSERADIYEGLSLLLAPINPEAAERASLACEAIRTAESQQLSFLLLFRDPAN